MNRMGRLLDEDDVIGALMEQFKRNTPIAIRAKLTVEALPPAQPEIIRCKDCGHWDRTWQNDFAPNYHYCSLVDGTRSGDFYCADAERRR